MLKRPWPRDVVTAPASADGHCVNVFNGVYEPRRRRRWILSPLAIVITFALGFFALAFCARPAVALFVAIAEVLR